MSKNVQIIHRFPAYKASNHLPFVQEIKNRWGRETGGGSSNVILYAGISIAYVEGGLVRYGGQRCTRDPCNQWMPLP